MIISLPENVKRIIGALNIHGFAAYAVGGCVRDVLLNRIPGDWDITTDALPEQIKSIFSRTVDTGIAHGTVTVLMGGEAYEVTTFRIDGEYRDARHPESVSFVPELSEDLRRRDFTINAMAYNDEEGLIDLYGGIRDLEAGIIRCVGDPVHRFTEDALRMMRAVRFAAQLGFEIHEDTAAAIRKMCGNISRVSAERIQVELTKLMTSDNPGLYQLAVDTGIAHVVLPEAELNGPVGNALSLAGALPGDRILRLAALFINCSGETAHRALRRLKFDNEAVNNVTRLTDLVKEELPRNEEELRRLINRTGLRLFEMSMEIRAALAETLSADDDTARIICVNEMYRTVCDRGDCISLRDLALKGADLVEMGYETGPAIGDLLNKALDLVLKYPEKNKREVLSEYLNNNETR